MSFRAAVVSEGHVFKLPPLWDPAVRQSGEFMSTTGSAVSREALERPPDATDRPQAGR